MTTVVFAVYPFIIAAMLYHSMSAMAAILWLGSFGFGLACGIQVGATSAWARLRSLHEAISHEPVSTTKRTNGVNHG